MQDVNLQQAIKKFENSDRSTADYMELFGVVKWLREDGMSYSAMKAAIDSTLTVCRKH